MVKQSKLTLTIVAVFVCALVSNASADICFNFNQLQSGSNATAIESYMESKYGSDIAVLNAIVGDDSGPLGPDSYIQNISTCGKNWFSISFNEVAITSVSFDWAVDKDAFHAFAEYVDNEGVFEEYFMNAWSWDESGHVGTVYFDSPVKTLKFSDCYMGDIQLDNLCVKPVPEPATLCLLGLGGLVFLRKRK